MEFMIKKELDQLKEMIHVMCRKVEGIYFYAIDMLKKKDEKMLNEIFKMDVDLNQMEVEIDNQCLKLLALKEPYAIDFRFIVAVMKSTRDLERVGDESKTIAKWGLKSDLNYDSNIELQKMIEFTTQSIQSAMNSLMYEDIEYARDALKLEYNIDDYEEILLGKDPSLSSGLVIRALERIGDLATNIAENVIYYLEAKDIRHQDMKDL